MNAPTRPVLRWHGGKWKLAPQILPWFPPHRVYVEPYGGAASMLLRKGRAYAEVYNDLDDDVVNLFQILRDREAAEELKRRLELTPFARAEFESAWQPGAEPIEAARFLIIRSFMGFGSNAHNAMGPGHKKTGFRANSSRSGTIPAEDWRNYPDALDAIVTRLEGVVIERRPAIAVMAAHDAPATLHYVDPPYITSTRSPANKYDLKHRMYRHEMTDDDHIELVAFLKTLAGMVVLSGYPSPLYDEALTGWKRVEIAAYADGARPRTEVLWINPAAVDALERKASAGTLFERASA